MRDHISELGQAYQAVQQGDFFGASLIFSQVIDFLESVGGTQYSEYSDSILMLAQIKTVQFEQLDQACELYEKVISNYDNLIEESLLQPPAIGKYAEASCLLAALNYQFGKPEKSIAQLENAAEVTQTHIDQFDFLFEIKVKVLKAKANIYLKQKQPKLALRAFEECKDILTTNLGDEHEKTKAINEDILKLL